MVKQRRSLLVVVGVVGALAVAALAVILWLRPSLIVGEGPAPTLPPEAEPVGDDGTLYETDFNTAGEWETFDDGFISAQVENGQLIVAVSDMRDVGAWSGLERTFEDFVLETTAQKVSGVDEQSGVIVVFRLTDTDNYNRFDVTPDGLYALTMVREGAAIPVSDLHASGAINTGDTANTIRIEAVGEVFRFFINGEQVPLCVNPAPDVQAVWEDANDPASGCIGGEVVTEWVNSDLPRGKVGLGAQGITGLDEDFNPTPAEAAIAFEDVTISVVE